MTATDFTLQERHEAEIKALVHRDDGNEAAAYVLFGRAGIGFDPWDGRARVRLTSYAVLPIPDDELIAAAPDHVSWSTRSFLAVCRRAKEEGLVPGIVHSHPGGFPRFSAQDDRNERELHRLARNRNGAGAELASLLLIGGTEFKGRLWAGEATPREGEAVLCVGRRLVAHAAAAEFVSEAWARQALAFGPAFNEAVRRLKVAVVGCGGTGSPTAMLLARLGVGHIVLVDEDVVEVSNLNRLYGAGRADADAKARKVDVVAREIARMGLGTKVVAIPSWVAAPDARDALCSCDLIFGCTDDHSGRLFLNRFAYFYLRPVIDVGLSIEADPKGGLRDMTARVTVLAPGAPCLLCRGIARPDRAREEELKRTAPDEYERQRREAYVRGGGNPAPAVVTFTTEAATMAVNEMLHGLIDFRGEGGWVWQRARRLDRAEERRQGAKQADACPICVEEDYWGLGDVDPFLDRVG